MPLNLYKRLSEGYLRADLANGRGGPAQKFSRISDAVGEDGDPMLYFRPPTPPAPSWSPVREIPDYSLSFPPHHRARWPADAETRLLRAARATGAEWIVALDNGLTNFALQGGKGPRWPGGATYWSVNRALAAREPTYPRLGTASGRALVLHNPSGSGVAVADDVFCWTPDPGPCPDEWLAYAQEYVALDVLPDGPAVTLVAVDIGAWGGVMVLLRLVEELCALGVNAQLVHAVYHEHQMRFPFSPKKVPTGEWKRLDSAVTICTNWWSASMAPGGQVLAAFYQDDEGLFRRADGTTNLTKAVIDRYVAIPNRVINSEWALGSCCERYGLKPEDFTVIPVGIDTALFRPGEKQEDPLRIVSMWRPVTPRRGHERLEDVYKRLKAKYGARVSLEVFGETQPSPAVVDKHWGWCGQEKVAEVLRGASVIMEPSDFQGFGLALAEGMAAGCAGVSTDCGGIDMYANEDNCLVVPHDDLFDAMCRVIDDAALRQRLQAAGPGAVAHLAWPEVGKQWWDWLVALADQHGLVLD